MKCLKNLIGVLISSCLLVFSYSCQNGKNEENIGRELIKRDLDQFINYYVSYFQVDDFLVKKVYIEKEVKKLPSEKREILERYFASQLKEYELDETRFYEFNTTGVKDFYFPNNTISNDKYFDIKISFCDFSINKNKDKLSFIVCSNIRNGIGNIMEIYFYKKVNNEWILNGKRLLLE